MTFSPSAPKARVLVVDDDRAVGMVLSALLTQAGHQAHFVTSGEEALAALALRSIDVVISDVRMPGMDGLELLSAVKKRASDVPVVLLTAHGTVALAVEAMKAGAADFMQKPFDRDEVLFVVGKVLEATRSAASRPPERAEPGDAPKVIGDSAPMREVMDRLKKAAPSMATVLLRGESGSGKEVAARAVHAMSPRASGPFVAVHCGALPDNLLESELFGYERGAFTGATQRKPGRVELANGGTLFLDEIGDVTPAVQVKLLRLLQEKEFIRLGATRPEKADVRFVAATHRDLESMVREGTFREDLFYRLNVVPVRMPSLAERPSDVPPLARAFASRIAAEQRPGVVLEPDAVELLERAPWPGNVRELANFVERLVIFADSERIGAADVERELARRPLVRGPDDSARGATVAPSSPPASPSSPPGATLDARRHDAERGAIRDALTRAAGNRTQAARLLGVSRRTLYNKLAELGLENA